MWPNLVKTHAGLDLSSPACAYQAYKKLVKNNVRQSCELDR